MEGTPENLVDQFHELEKQCIGYDNYINTEDKYYIETLEKLRQLVIQIQRQHIFSDNEAIKEIDTDHLKLLMIPYYEADLLYRIMDNRPERVKLSQTFYLEYLKLMNHYELLDKDQKAKWKQLMKEAEGQEQEGVDMKNAPMAQTYGPTNFDHFANRNEKIAMFKRKKELEQQLDMLKDYKDEDMKRSFYMAQITHSILKCFEQLSLINQEVKLLEHQSTLPRDSNNQPVQEGTYVKKPIKVVHIPKKDDMPYLLSPYENPDGSVLADPTNPDNFQKLFVQQDSVEQQMHLRQQYQNQVFKPGHILPTMSIEELADLELADALKRQGQDEERKKREEEEDPDSEEVLERERKRVAASDDWKDYNPKGSGNTKRI